jgi:NADH-quinone oxidoreductase subunit C/D
MTDAQNNAADLSQRFSVKVVEHLRKKLPNCGLEFVQNAKYADEDAIYVKPDAVLEVAREVKPFFPFLMDVCGVDYPNREKRLEVVYHYADPEKLDHRLRVKTRIAQGETLASVTSEYKAANWFEREAFDMFGIKFTGHPDLRRILCHDEFVGHPLLKDYPAEKNQSCRQPLEHVFAKDRERMMADVTDHLDEKIWINIGPAHPATHGTLRFMSILSGENIEKMDVEIGYLHRCFEKMCENHTYTQIIPYTDRLNYCSAPINNNAWCAAIEKMMGIQVPERAKVMRVILDEFSRIIDHFVCISTNAVDLGALTNFWLGFAAREKVYELFESLCGARLTVSLARVGGMGFDLPEGWVAKAKETLKEIQKSHNDLSTLLTKNRIFINRMKGVSPIAGENAIKWGWTGPCLRAAGVARDLRVDAPYYTYSQYKFDIPVGHRGDAYDRYLVRMEEIQQSMKIITQALEHLPGGPVKVDDPTISMPSKQDVYGNIEGLMNQFMMVINDVQPPAGEIYHAVEGANGELGFYVVSDGSGIPYRVKCRPPCFALFQAVPEIIQGQQLADLIACLGSINIIAGELDR